MSEYMPWIAQSKGFFPCAGQITRCICAPFTLQRLWARWVPVVKQDPSGHEVACFSFHVCQCWKKCIKNARVYLFVAGSTSNEQLYGVNSRQVPWRMMSCQPKQTKQNRERERYIYIYIYIFATESK